MKKLLFAACILIVSCQHSLYKNVETAMHKYDNYILHVDAEGISGMFTPDGVLAQHGGMSIVGRDSIEKFLDQFKYIKVEAQKSTTDSIRKLGDTVFQYGKYYQRAIVNSTKAEIYGMFQANWLIQPDGKLMLKRMSAWSTSNK